MVENWSRVMWVDEITPQKGGGPTRSKKLNRLRLSCGHHQVRSPGQKIPKRTRCEHCTIPSTANKEKA